MDLEPHYRMHNLITNFHTRDRPRYEKAIELFKTKTGKDFLHIEDNAYDYRRNLVPDLNALCTSVKGCGLTDFWEIYDKLKQEWVPINP
jgi:hypothetical protein